ncbi:hypothetical protein M5K25_007233 [Dendrobium thyrsiflorum]|uniref:Uncharacterized protein n=1 Tax=Dendrobium thyrsiflorum TaxID=117978 RepID=A0ABD0VL05_DENTH
MRGRNQERPVGGHRRSKREESLSEAEIAGGIKFSAKTGALGIEEGHESQGKIKLETSKIKIGTIQTWISANL